MAKNKVLTDRIIHKSNSKLMLRLYYKLRDSAYQPPLKLLNPAPMNYPLQYIILSTLSAHNLQKKKATRLL